MPNVHNGGTRFSVGTRVSNDPGLPDQEMASAFPPPGSVYPPLLEQPNQPNHARHRADRTRRPPSRPRQRTNSEYPSGRRDAARRGSVASLVDPILVPGGSPAGRHPPPGPGRARVRRRRPAPSLRVPRSRAGSSLWPVREPRRPGGRCPATAAPGHEAAGGARSATPRGVVA